MSKRPEARAADAAAALVASREWCIRMARLEGDAEIAAGRLAVDPVFEDGDPPLLPATHDRAGALPDRKGG